MKGQGMKSLAGCGMESHGLLFNKFLSNFDKFILTFATAEFILVKIPFGGLIYEGAFGKPNLEICLVHGFCGGRFDYDYIAVYAGYLFL